MLRTRGIGVTLLVREAGYQAKVLPAEASAMVNDEIRRHGVDLRLSTEIAQIETGSDGRAIAVVTSHGDRVACDFLALTIGVQPNVAWLEGSGIEIERGVLVDEALRTNVEGIFAAGDCAELRTPGPGRRATEPLWYTARQQGLVAAYGLTGEPRPYRPGLFYNSAKFFDLEYQVYGRIEPEPRAGEATLLARSPDGRQALHVQYLDGTRDEPGAVVGFNAMGVRLRHDVCAAWIAGKTPLREVVARLSEADFDPEFAPSAGRWLLAAFNAQYPRFPIRDTVPRGWRPWMAVNRLVGRDVLPGVAKP
jgi:NADPH-dependent 2,4-dienoyl-CoA reductase/sulfur reductase-like enzyme